MKLSEVLVKPIVTEKTNKLTDKRRTYAFRVDRKANKLEIRKAVEQFYNVTVLTVNTAVTPAKAKNRQTKSGIISGRKPAKKKAIVTIAENEEINLYGEI